MCRFLPFFLAVPVFLFAARSTASSTLDFDRGADMRPIIEQAREAVVSGGDAVSPKTDPAGDAIWISISRQDVAALGDEFGFPARTILAQNSSISIYGLKISELDLLCDVMHRRFRRSPGFFAHDSLSSALQDLAEPPAAAARAFSIDQGEKVSSMLKLVDEKAVTAVIASLSSYKNRYYRSATGIASSKWIYGHWKELAAGRPDITVTAFPHSAYPQESVILTVNGTVEPDKVVVIGAHQDSIAGFSGDPVAPGADDNASGTAVVNEVIRVVAASGYKPAQTIKFIAFAAEEVGLRGSQEIAASFKNQGVAVQGMLNLDMTNYKGSAGDIYLISDNTNADQNAFLGKLVTAYTGYSWAATRCGYACSDHASWTKNGFTASFPFEAAMGEENPNIHSAKDTLAQMGGGAAHGVKFAKLAVAYVVEMAK